MIRRNEKGKLVFNHLDMMVHFDNLFAGCKNEGEVEWLHEQLESFLNHAKDDVLKMMQE